MNSKVVEVLVALCVKCEEPMRIREEGVVLHT